MAWGLNGVDKMVVMYNWVVIINVDHWAVNREGETSKTKPHRIHLLMLSQEVMPNQAKKLPGCFPQEEQQ